MSVFLKIANQRTLKVCNAYKISALKSSTTAADTTFLKYDKDPGPAFLDSQTQKLLKSMTRLRLDKVYRKRAILNNKVEYKFMTTEQIEGEIKAAIRKADALLQMPPIVMIQEDKSKIISSDPGLQSFDTAKFIFTDITFGLKDTERTIVVRQPDGTLESGNAEIRKRMNQIYFPRVGRRLRQPQLFNVEYLKNCMDQGNYEFILDRACVQFEPNESEFHAITEKVYTHINETKKFDDLRSTRHFGPMCFFLAWHRMIDDLLIDMIRRDFLQNAVELICLMQKLNGAIVNDAIVRQLDVLTQKKAENLTANVLAIGKGELQKDIEARVGKTTDDFAIDDVCFAFIEVYNKSDALKKAQIQMSLNTYRETTDEKRRLLLGLHTAHGIN